ncbi:hypothetical protein GCK72_006758 [Caenorhabditis remanei]|uniref:Uncharacterized protein n=1 Tax=Caenorhabditis remanei TaxID=31234 RepID=A0A6A5HFS1_CAERE|nr:hypothetical protein GCK72_006758 [Caenorhabditis remanei]KAF1766800.1 hypothetical protein GCK72_006758 [Caenorhabditis remanei]
MNWRLITFFALVGLGTVKATVLVTILVARMYRTLKEYSSRMSRRALDRHKIALRSLIMQFMITPITFFPACICLLTILIPTYYSQLISWYACVVITTHSIFNSIVVVLTYPEFRRTLFFCKNKSRRVSIIGIPHRRPSGVYTPGEVVSNH